MKAREASSAPVVMPLLATVDEAAKIPEVYVTKPVVPGMVVVLADAVTTARGTVGVTWLTRAEITARKKDTFNLWKEAFVNLEKDLNIGLNKENDVYLVQHARGLGAAAVAMPGFVEQATKWVSSQKVTIAVPNPSGVLVAKSETSASKQVTAAALDSTFDGGGATPLVPCVLEYAFGVLKMKAQRGKAPK
jgi:hypothetical protein